ncbi:MAG: hypothetical protein ACR2JK_19320 [Geodermatophilaceae bacterium]
MATACGTFLVDGRVEDRLVLTVADLRQDFLRQEIVVSFVSGEKRERHVYLYRRRDGRPPATAPDRTGRNDDVGLAPPRRR